MANSDSDEFFADADIAEVERDMRADLLAARTRIAQGLPVVGRLLVVGSDGEVPFQGLDATAYLWRFSAKRRGSPSPPSSAARR